VLEAFREAPGQAGLFLDFDGTLSNIVARPEMARPVPGAVDILSRLGHSYALVAIVSGRPDAQIKSLLPVPELEVVGLYGLVEAPPSQSAAEQEEVAAVREAVDRAAELVPGARVEDKGLSLAVHYRGVADVPAAEQTLSKALLALAGERNLRVMRGKMVLEVVPRMTPGKGSVIVQQQRARNLIAVLYAGDDVADLDAFSALDELARGGVATVKVAVRSAEAPPELLERADVTVAGPAGLVGLLSQL
jgi:trehalose 6-phosphate phosphatase